MSTHTNAWRAFVSAINAYEHARLPLLGAHLPDFVNALWVCMFLRAHMTHRTHWLRQLLLVFVLSVGGTTAAAILMGVPPRWLLDSSNFTAVCAAFAAVYWSGPLDAAPVLLALPGVRHAHDVLRALSITHAMVRGGAERAATELPGAPFHTAFVLCFIASCGGGLIAEFANLLLLPRSHYWNVRNGPSPAALIALLGSFLYCFVIRDYSGATVSAVRALVGSTHIGSTFAARSLLLIHWVARCTPLSSGSGCEWNGGEPTSGTGSVASAAIGPADMSAAVASVIPLADNVEDGIAMLALVLVPLMCPWIVHPKALQDAATQIGRTLLPYCFVPTFVPAELGPSALVKRTLEDASLAISLAAGAVRESTQFIFSAGTLGAGAAATLGYECDNDEGHLELFGYLSGGRNSSSNAVPLPSVSSVPSGAAAIGDVDDADIGPCVATSGAPYFDAAPYVTAAGTGFYSGSGAAVVRRRVHSVRGRALAASSSSSGDDSGGFTARVGGVPVPRRSRAGRSRPRTATGTGSSR